MKPITKILGVVLIAIGIAGFFVDGTLLVFEVDLVHNIVHLLSGAIALLVMNNYGHARLFLIVFGLVYAAVTVIGFTMGGDILGLFHANKADNYLHLAIATLCLIPGLGSSSRA